MLREELNDQAARILDYRKGGLLFNYDLLGYGMMALSTFFFRAVHEGGKQAGQVAEAPDDDPWRLLRQLLFHADDRHVHGDDQRRGRERRKYRIAFLVRVFLADRRARFPAFQR